MGLVSILDWEQGYFNSLFTLQLIKKFWWSTIYPWLDRERKIRVDRKKRYQLESKPPDPSRSVTTFCWSTKASNQRFSVFRKKLKIICTKNKTACAVLLAWPGGLVDPSVWLVAWIFMAVSTWNSNSPASITYFNSEFTGNDLRIKIIILSSIFQTTSNRLRDWW